MSDVSSAGIARGTPSYGKTCRKDVLGRVDIPVVPGPAGRARPVPGRQAELREPVPARRARLRAGIPAVYHDQLASGALAFVGELAAELAPPAVGDRAGQVPVADSRTLRWARATLAAALARFAEPRWQRASLRW